MRELKKRSRLLAEAPARFLGRLTLAAAGFFGLIVLVTLLRAEKSVANGALTVITLLAIGVAVAANLRGFGPGGGVRMAICQRTRPGRGQVLGPVGAHHNRQPQQ